MSVRIKTIATVILGFGLNFCFAQKQNYSPEIAKYVTFLGTQNTSAKDYVLNLFKKYDIVILCERDHREATQYDLIYDIVSSPYFEKNVGYIMTEVGSYSIRQDVLNFTKTKFDNDSLKQIRQAEIYRNVFFPPLWNNTNFYNFWGRLNTLNNTLPEDLQINLLVSGTKNPTLNETKDSASMRKYIVENFFSRDSLMASYIMQTFDSLQRYSNRKKTLVIMNYRHAFSKSLSGDGTINVGDYLFKKYAGRVANVYINWMASTNIIAASDTSKAKMFQNDIEVPIQEGKWDAAFKAAGKENLGFDFQHSPFGNDSFDIWPDKTDYTYSDIFTGFVFYLPLEKHLIQIGVKNFLLGADIEKIVNEWNLFNQVTRDKRRFEYTPEHAKELSEDMSTYRESDYYADTSFYNPAIIKPMINQWLKE